MNKYIKEAREYAQNVIHFYYKEDAYDKEGVDAVCHALHILELIQEMEAKDPLPKTPQTK